MRANEARKGTAIMYNHEICIITEATHRTPGNLRAFMQLTMKGLKSSQISGCAVRRFRNNTDFMVVINGCTLSGFIRSHRSLLDLTIMAF